MNKTKRGLTITGVAAMVAGTGMLGPAAAQEERLTVEVGQCVELATPEERLACFEAQVEVARNAPPGSRDGGSDPDAAPPDILAKVVELEETVPNAYLITLDNGQVWRQTQPKYYPLRPGYEVRIYWTKWKTFRLTNTRLRSQIHVERVR